MSELDVQLGRQLGLGSRDAGVGRRRLLGLGELGGLRLLHRQRVLGRQVLSHLLVLGIPAVSDSSRQTDNQSISSPKNNYNPLLCGCDLNKITEPI